jgi:hypothetical protein
MTPLSTPPATLSQGSSPNRKRSPRLACEIGPTSVGCHDLWYESVGESDGGVFDRKAAASDARRIAQRDANLPLSGGAWPRIASGKARDERNRTIARWLALALAREDAPTTSLLDALLRGRRSRALN